MKSLKLTIILFNLIRVYECEYSDSDQHYSSKSNEQYPESSNESYRDESYSGLRSVIPVADSEVVDNQGYTVTTLKYVTPLSDRQEAESQDYMNSGMRSVIPVADSEVVDNQGYTVTTLKYVTPLSDRQEAESQDYMNSGMRTATFLPDSQEYTNTYEIATTDSEEYTTTETYTNSPNNKKDIDDLEYIDLETEKDPPSVESYEEYSNDPYAYAGSSSVTIAADSQDFIRSSDSEQYTTSTTEASTTETPTTETPTTETPTTTRSTTKTTTTEPSTTTTTTTETPTTTTPTTTRSTTTTTTTETPTTTTPTTTRSTTKTTTTEPSTTKTTITIRSTTKTTTTEPSTTITTTTETPTTTTPTTTRSTTTTTTTETPTTTTPTTTRSTTKTTTTETPTTTTTTTTEQPISVKLTKRPSNIPHPCDIETPYHDLAPVYLQVLSDYESSLLSKDKESFVVKTNMTILAICPSTFAHDNTITVLTLRCYSDYLVHENNYFYGELICAKNDRSELYEKIGDKECPKTNFAIGLNITGQIIIYAEACYDRINHEIYYIHYRANKPSEFVSSYIPEIFVIDNSYDTNANWNKDQGNKTDGKYVKKRSLQPVTNQLLYKSIQDAISQVYTKTELSSFQFDSDYIQRQIKKILNNDYNFVHYQEVNLFTPDIYEPYVQNPFKNRKILNTFLGWNNLISGNWKLFKNLLRLRSMEETLEVYMGTSHSVEVPIISPFSNCLYPIERESGAEVRHELNVNLNGYTVKIPKYIWTYVKSSELLNSFVVVGINSPYYEYFPDSYLPCNDVCDGIEWLVALEKFKRYDVFGKIFCCPVNDVKHILKGFPITL